MLVNLTQRHLTNSMMYVILDEESESAFNAMSTPQSWMWIRMPCATTLTIKITTDIDTPITINDTTRPSVKYVEYKPIHGMPRRLTSAVYHPGFGNMTITCSPSQ